MVSEKNILEDYLAIQLYIAGLSGSAGDQEVAGSTPAEVGNILSWRLIMKYSHEIFYGHSLPSADSRRAVVSFW